MFQVFASAVILLMDLSSGAAPKKEITLSFNFELSGTTVCKGQKTVISGERYHVCEGTARGNRILMRVEAKETGRQQVQVSAEVEEIDANGKILNLSNPRIMGLDGEEALIEVGDSAGHNLMSLAVTASFVK